MDQAKRVAKNTGFLYAKMLISMVISLYATRLVLNALGIVDYGIFNLVGGVIAMLSFLNASMTVSSQRYFSVELGKNNSSRLKDIFKSSTYLHLLIGFVVVLILEILGVFIFDGFLNIPSDRITTAKWVYQFMIFSAFFTMNSVPFDAVINSHENMLFDAIVGIFESFLKLGIAIWLIYYDADRLLLYAILVASLTIFIRIVKSVYCIRKYPECKIDFKENLDKPLFNEMLNFASWNLIGSLAGIGRNQGLALILNLFFGAVVNAAYGVANQVAGQLNAFSSMMLKAVNPQIMKSEGASDRFRMLRIAMTSSKLSFLLLALFAIPCIFEMNNILTLWLKEVPEYTVIFCNLILIAAMTNQLTIGLASALQATGKIKLYQTVVGLLLLVNLPIAYFLLKMGFPAYSALISYIAIEALACCFRIMFLKNIAGLSIKHYLDRVLFRIILPVLFSVIACYFITTMVQMSLRFLVTGVVSALVLFTSIYFFGLYKEEKQIVASLVSFVKGKIKN
ncbi:MATE family efflux transporter [Cellulophaga sp. L1A9]|uniref:MATE family efflux transporter n=1 Tax=Cellulophaga sp. L1A9 TaxID=2686362 RepID=UPI0018EED538|nr:MATE family efflux transporter [Cellulophaga sp. L1A9]